MYALRSLFVARCAALCAAIAVVVSFAGCTRQNAPTDPAKSRQALTTGLESWKSGDPPTRIRAASPSILMVDPAWDAGQTLQSFEIVGPEFDDGTNLFCPVKLVLQDAQGNVQTREVRYVINTSPSITVFRDGIVY